MPKPARVPPKKMVGRGPNRSYTRDMGITLSVYTRDRIDGVNAVAALVQPNSFIMGLKKTPKEKNTLNIMLVAKDAAKMIHP